MLEGDGFLAYYQWQTMLSKGRELTGRDGVQNAHPSIRAPLLAEAASNAVQGNAVQRIGIFNDNIFKSRRCFDKLEQDSFMGGRLYPQLLIFRACRLFNYRFVTLTPMPELIQEINDFFQFLPRIRDREVLLLSHLAPYKTAADVADTEALPDPLWEFWRQRCVTLSEWYIAAADVALYI